VRWQSVWPLTRSQVAAASELNGLLDLMERKRPTSPVNVSLQASAATEQLKMWRKQLAQTPDDATRYFPADTGQLADRDDLYQLLLGLAAVKRAAGEREARPFEDAFRHLRQPIPAGGPAPIPADAKQTIDDLLRSLALPKRNPGPDAIPRP
jgi:hypothetical protein